MTSILDTAKKWAFSAQLRRWRGQARAAANQPLGELRQSAQRARALRGALDDVLHVADTRLAYPRIGSQNMAVPADADWSWRPEAFCGQLPVAGYASIESRTQLGSEMKLFHDCRWSEMTLRQMRNSREQDLAPYGLSMDVFRFDGSFLSLVVDLPPEAAMGIRRQHLVRLDAVIESESPLEIYARLNLQHGPNSEQLVRELPLDGSNIMVEFDLAYIEFNEKRAERLWLDLIFEGPQMNQIKIYDLTLSRSPRAGI